MIRTVNPNQIAKDIEEFEIIEASPRPKTSNFIVEVSHENKLLFT